MIPSNLSVDVRYAVRMLLKHPVYTAGIVLALALGLGANTTIFAFVDALLFRPLPVERLDRVVRVGAVHPQAGVADLFSSSYPVYTDYRDGATAFDGLAAYADDIAFHLATGGGRPARVVGAVVSGNYFEVLATRAWRGRLLSPDDDRAPGGHPVVVIGYGLWQQSFGGRDDVLGQPVRLNGRPFTIVGIAPPGFVGVSLESLPQLWVSLAMADLALPDLSGMAVLTSRHVMWLDMVGRLTPEATIATAQAELEAIASRRIAQQPESDRDPMPRVEPASSLVIESEAQRGFSHVAWLLLGVVGLVLVIACADAAALLMVRAEQRQREIAVRLAIGASRGRLIRQLLVESLLLAALACAVGLLLAWWSADVLMAILPPRFPMIPLGTGPMAHPRVLLFAIAVTTAAGLVYGLLPAWLASRPNLIPALKGEGAVAPRRGVPVNSLFVVTEIAVSVLLLVAAGLLLQTLRNVAAVSPGFNPDNVVTATLDVSRQGYPEDDRTARLDEVLARVRAMPGVTAAGLGRMVPVGTGGMRVSFELPDYARQPGEFLNADFNPVTPGFLAALGAPLLRGRDFAESDAADSPGVAMVNQSFADKYFANQEAVGQSLRDMRPDGSGLEIVGVVGDVRYRNLRENPGPMIYVPQAQSMMPQTTLVTRTSLPIAGFSEALRRTVADVDPDLPLFQLLTVRERMAAALARERLLAWLLGAFAALAVVLSAAGLFGVLSYVTTRRTREFGIRLALGATPGQVRQMVLGQSLALTLTGVVLGLAAALFAGRALASLLFGVTPADPFTYAATAAGLALVGLAAGQLPARRATRVDPATALRYE